MNMKTADRTVLEWLLEEKNPEVRLRTLKEYQKSPEDAPVVTECKTCFCKARFMSVG